MELKKKKNPWYKKFDFTTGCSSTSRGGEYSGRIETPLAVDWAYDLTWIRELLKASRIRQTSDSSWEFLNMENEQIETAQNNSYG